jgi:hypothetical protein
VNPEAEASSAAATGPRAGAPARQFRYRVAFFVTALVALGLVVTLPFSVKSVVDDVLGPATGRVVHITPRESGPPPPNYTKLHLAVMLVLLIASAAAYSVFLRPLSDLVVNAGALVLGVWGIRGILTPSNLYYITSVDLALSMVIIFVLGALTVRALIFVHDEAELNVLGRRRREAPGGK